MDHNAVVAAPRSLSRMEAFERLATPIPDRSQSVPLPPLTSTKKLTRDQEKASIEHLYTQSVSHKKAKLEELEKTFYKDTSKHSPVVDADDLSTIVTRLYELSVKQKQTNLQTAVQERLKVHQRKVKHLDSPDELRSIVDRLYNTSAKEKERSDKLFEMYNPPNPIVRRTKTELEANDERYYKGGFAKKS